MKTLKYILIFIASMGFLNSCLIEDELDLDQNAQGYNLATFDKNTINLVALANGDEYQRQVQMKLVGPTFKDVPNPITVTVKAAASSTAEEGVHYRIENKTIVLSPENNFLGSIDVTMLTEGNTPPMEDSPEYEDYEAPVLNLEIESATGDDNVTASGKDAKITLNFTPPNPYAGLYTAHIIYHHPSAGEYPNNISTEEDQEKELSAITGRKCETGFAVWPTTDLCWITVNSDNSITFEVADTWTYDVMLGDPYDASKVSHYDPETGVIYLYYHYYGDGGPRIFWETFTPEF